MTQSWITFIDAIETAKADLRCNENGAWFRGVTCAKHRLYPSLLRPRARISQRRELSIYEEFTDFDGDSERTITSWDRLVRLQHYGVPTRLLDWTEVFGVALFFAVRRLDAREPISPAIWIINPFLIAQRARNSKDKTIGAFHNDSDLDYFQRFLTGAEQPWPFQSPMPYRPPKLTPRIRAQKGFFTVHGLDRRPLDAIYLGGTRQVRLPQDALPDARKFLDLAGIDSLCLFPDYEGFARRVRDRYE